MIELTNVVYHFIHGSTSLRRGALAAALAAALLVVSGSAPAGAQVPGASYGEGPGATGVAPGVAGAVPGRSGAEGPALVNARQLPNTGDGSMAAEGSASGTPAIAAVGALAGLGLAGLAFARKWRRRIAR